MRFLLIHKKEQPLVLVIRQQAERLRDKGLEAFRRQGVPTAKTEAWKYTKPRDLNADDFVMNESNFLAELSETAAEALAARTNSPPATVAVVPSMGVG